MKKKLKEKNKKLVIISIVMIAMLLILGGFNVYRDFVLNIDEIENGIIGDEGNDSANTEYNLRLIKDVNKDATENYLVSPYSIEIALAMLRDGASGTSREEIEALIGDRTINDLSVSKRVNVANGLFVNESYKNSVKNSYYSLLKTKYKSDVIYDKFNNPDTINNWTNKETMGMIPHLLDDLSPSSILVLVNALAIDVEWKASFDCGETTPATFKKKDGSKEKVEMMHKMYGEDAKYFDTNDSKGVILPYKTYDDKNLEFVGILPDGNVKDYVASFTKNKLDTIDKKAVLATDNDELDLAIPTFKYSFEIDNLPKTLNNLGVREVFSYDSDLSNMVDGDAYVSSAIHKTFIDFNETGTKAAAATAIVVDKNGVDMGGKIVVEFNRPFAYIIRDSKTKEMLFFGVVYEPNKWNGSTCKGE